MKNLYYCASLFFLLLMASCASEDPARKARLEAVQTFADNVLSQGSDKWSGRNTPLLCDGIDLATGKPLEYKYNGDTGVRGEAGSPNSWIVHNLASQQNLFRTFVALSNLTGEEKYMEAAERSIRFHFDSLLDESGLLRWGGHQLIDMKTLTPIGHAWRQNQHSHELKDVYPFYDLMWKVDQAKTAEFIRAFWNAHVLDWSRLEFNRHGGYGKASGKLWESEYKQPEPFFEGDGLTFLNTGSDLIYSGGILYSLKAEEGALIWAKRLSEQYVRSRHPKTGLGSYQFSKPTRHKQPPDGPLTGLLTFSSYGDRAENQFGKDFPGSALEGWALFSGAGIYTIPSLMQLELAERLGDQGKEFLEWTISGLKAYATYAYNPGDNTFKPMWADGTDLTGYSFSRTGYFGKEGRVLQPSPADEAYLFTYARAYRLSSDEEIWNMARSIMKGLKLGDPGENKKGILNMDTENSSPQTVFALLELHEATGDENFLKLAEKVADNMVKRSFNKGFFTKDVTSTRADFDAVEPLAILSLEAAIRGEKEKVPVYSGGRNNLGLKTE